MSFRVPVQAAMLSFIPKMGQTLQSEFSAAPHAKKLVLHKQRIMQRGTLLPTGVLREYGACHQQVVMRDLITHEKGHEGGLREAKDKGGPHSPLGSPPGLGSLVWQGG